MADALTSDRKLMFSIDDYGMTATENVDAWLGDQQYNARFMPDAENGVLVVSTPGVRGRPDIGWTNRTIIGADQLAQALIAAGLIPKPEDYPPLD